MKKRKSAFWKICKSRYFFFSGIICLIFSSILAGCESCNDNVNNKRFWYPSLFSPGYLNPQCPSYIDPDREQGSSEGLNPYMDNTIGPRSLQALDRGRDMPRERVVTANETYEKDKILNNKANK